MADHPSVETLQGMEFFSDMETPQLEKLAGIAEELDFPQHTTIFHEHEVADRVFCVVTGKVSLVICVPSVGCRQIMTIGSGELFSWSPLLRRGRLSSTARTLAATKVISFEGAKLKELCEGDRQIGYEFMRRTADLLSDRLAATRLQLLDFGGAHLPAVALESD